MAGDWLECGTQDTLAFASVQTYLANLTEDSTILVCCTFQMLCSLCLTSRSALLGQVQCVGVQHASLQQQGHQKSDGSTRQQAQLS